MKNIFLLIISAFLFSVIQGCDKSATIVDPPVSTDVIFPLAVNNEWVYTKKYFDTTGAISSQSNTTLSIVKDSVRLGEKIYVNNQSVYFVNRTDGFWIFDITGKSDNQYLLLKYPCKLNETYNGAPTIYRNGVPNVATVTVASLNESVTVPAGTFTCIKYVVESHDPATGKKDDRVINYCSPKTGLIIYERYNYYDNGTKTRIDRKDELVRVTLK